MAVRCKGEAESFPGLASERIPSIFTPVAASGVTGKISIMLCTMLKAIRSIYT